MRKPEPLGTEFKNLVDGFQGDLVWKEIMEGKERMSKKEYSGLGGTAACVMRGVTATQDMDFIPNDQEEDNADKKRLYYGDSWFGSVKTAENVAASNNHCVMLIKTVHSRSPKKWLENAMIDYPGGTWITMEGTTEKTGTDLVIIGYKYNKKKVLTFVMTRGVGSTEKGEPYEARFPDKYGNLCIRHVARPECISNFLIF